jgi:transcriptional regulator with XRE-family HTH domain
MPKQSQPATPLAAKLVAARKAAGLSITDVSRRMPEVSRATVGHWFTGERQPLMDNLRKLCAVLDISLASLEADDPDFAQSPREKLLLKLSRESSPETLEAILAVLAAKNP